MLNQVQKLLAWMFLILSFMLMVTVVSFFFTSPGDTFYDMGQIVLKPETGPIYDLINNIDKSFNPIGEERLTAYLHLAYIGSQILLFFLLIAVLFFPNEEKKYPFGKDNIKFNDMFYGCLSIELIWTIAFFEAENGYLDFLGIVSLVALYYALYPVLQTNESLDN